ncbi:MAG: Crp/Fnr family transcriptional regulator [Allosphingosinicella sp.]
MSGAGHRAFLDDIGPEDQRAVLAKARIVKARKGQMVLGMGESSREVFLVLEGRLQALLYAANGREISLRDLAAGQLFGELAAIDGEARSASIVAATDVRLLAIPDDLFISVIGRSPQAAHWMIRRLTAQVRSLTHRVFEMSALHVQARLHCELLRLARTRGTADGIVDPAPTHADLANRIGSHREAVTRELGVLASQDILKISRRRLQFLDLERLEGALRATLLAPVAEEAGW